MRICPRCGLRSPDSAGRCDCGFDLGGGGLHAEERRRSLRRYRRGMAVGAIAALTPLVVTAVLFHLGPVRVIFWGLSVAGLTTLVSSARLWHRLRSAPAPAELPRARVRNEGD